MFSKLEEEKAAKAAEKKRKEAEKAQRQFDESPVGKARLAAKQGQRYFQTVFPIENVGRDALAVLGHSMQTQVTDIGDPIGIILTDIEKEGWQLMQAGFAFRQTHQDSRDKFLASGQQIAISEQTVGVYLFRRVSSK